MTLGCKFRKDLKFREVPFPSHAVIFDFACRDKDAADAVFDLFTDLLSDEEDAVNEIYFRERNLVLNKEVLSTGITKYSHEPQFISNIQLLMKKMNSEFTKLGLPNIVS